MLGGDTHTRITDLEVSTRFVTVPANSNLPFFRGVTHRIGKQVIKGAVELLFRTIDPKRRIRLDGQALLFLFDQRLNSLLQHRQHRRDCHRHMGWAMAISLQT